MKEKKPCHRWKQRDFLESARVCWCSGFFVTTWKKWRCFSCQVIRGKVQTVSAVGEPRQQRFCRRALSRKVEIIAKDSRRLRRPPSTSPPTWSSRSSRCRRRSRTLQWSSWIPAGTTRFNWFFKTLDYTYMGLLLTKELIFSQTSRSVEEPAL